MDRVDALIQAAVPGRALAAAFLAVGVFSGCTATSGSRTESFAGKAVPSPSIQGLSLENPAYRGLRIVIVPSENPRNALDASGRVGHFNEHGVRSFWTGGVVLNYELFADGLASTLQRSFKSVAKAHRLDEAVAMRPDLVAVLDAYFEYGSIFRDARVDVSAELKTPDNTWIDTAKGQGVRSPRSFSGFNGRKRVNAAIHAAVEEAQGRLVGALIASKALAEYANGKASASGAGLVERESLPVQGVSAVDRQAARHVATGDPAPRAGAKIAVLTFDLRGMPDPIEGSAIEAAVLESGFKVVDRSNLDLVMKEQKLALTGAVRASDAQVIGQLSGAQLFIVWSRTADDSTGSMRLLSVTEGDVLGSAQCFRSELSRCVEQILTSYMARSSRP